MREDEKPLPCQVTSAARGQVTQTHSSDTAQADYAQDAKDRHTHGRSSHAGLSCGAFGEECVAISLESPAGAETPCCSTGTLERDGFGLEIRVKERQNRRRMKGMNPGDLTQAARCIFKLLPIFLIHSKIQ